MQNEAEVWMLQYRDHAQPRKTTPMKKRLAFIRPSVATGPPRLKLKIQPKLPSTVA